MKEHDLKTWTCFYDEVIKGNKPWELRKNDRKFEVGDILNLRDWNPSTEKYTGRNKRFKVGYILQGGEFGLAEGYVIMSLVKFAVYPPSIVNGD